MKSIRWSLLYQISVYCQTVYISYEHAVEDNVVESGGA